MATTIPRVSECWLYDPRALAAPIQLDSPAWFVWLEQPTSISFSYPIVDRQHGDVVGFMTARKERRQRGYVYWSAYRRIHGKLRKHYLGPAQRVTAERLAAIAERYCTTGAAERAAAAATLQEAWAQQKSPEEAVVLEQGAGVQWEEVTTLPEPRDSGVNTPLLDVTSKEPRIMDNMGCGATSGRA